MKGEYYLIEKEPSKEGFCLFWKYNARGYTIDLDEAGLFDFEFCKRYIENSSTETFAISKEEFESKMKTNKIVWNQPEILKLNSEVTKEGRK